MRKILLSLIVVCLMPVQSYTTEAGVVLVAKNSKTKKKRTKKRSKKRRSKRTSRSKLVKALQMAKEKRYEEASMELFRLSLDPYYADKKIQIKYILGLMLYEMNLKQVSAFQFINIVKQGNSRYLRQSLEKLSLAADYLGDDTLLNYAISKVKINKFPKAHRNMLYYRIGEFQYNSDQLAQALKSLKKVSTSSRFYPKAKYMRAMVNAKLKNTNTAIKNFDQLMNFQADEGVTDEARVAAVIGKARTYYQRKKWDEAIELYREVPRDTEFWHDSIFESSWAMLRSGRFRSALSNFHTLHSEYYENVYQPESFILRGIIYLYICKYNEMEKVLNLFEKIYQPVQKQVIRILDTYKKPQNLYEMVKNVYLVEKGEKTVDELQWQIPYVVARRIYYEGDFRRTFQYIKKVEAEQDKLNSASATWQRSSIAKYSKKVLANRIKKAKKSAGRLVFEHLLTVKAELSDLFEQQDFIRFEMLKGKKQALKKKIAGKDLSDVQVDEGAKRDYYVQNGYEYWPFKGEYWLDELGNYHYVGVQACE